ncbi:transketolase [Natronospora cellulosivora (SeqCode)]
MLNDVASIIRGLSADGVEQANSGHPGLPIGCAEIGALLYGDVMKYDPKAAEWPDRDRFILSAGHGSMLMYSLLHLAGYDLTIEDLKNFRQLHSKTAGHPEYGMIEGIETTTGPLGQGFANAVGMAIAEAMHAAKFNTDQHKIVDHYTYTLLGDGGMMEGVVSEAASLAGHLGLGKLIAIYDDNQISIGGSTEITFTEDVAKRFEAYNWQVLKVDGHDIDKMRDAINEAKKENDKPTLIVAKTKIAFGAPTKEGSADAHGAPLGEDEIKGLKEKIGLPVDEKFYVSNEVREFFEKHQAELKVVREEWEKNFAEWAKANPELKELWDNGLQFKIPGDFREAIMNMEIESPIASRAASGKALAKIADILDYLVGGSADLAPSNKTYLDKYDEIQKDNFNGRNFRFGVREHAMGAIVNGIVLHRGFRPYCSTFLVFSDYMRHTVRMAALMKIPVVFVFTHDSIYVGEDGPTHEPIEHVESLRLIPDLKVYRPADAEETKAAWVKAIENTEGPTVLILTRQGLPLVADEGVDTLSGLEKGAYIVRENNNPDVVLMGSGSEVSLANEVAEILESEGKACRVVSIPERKDFLAQGNEYIEELLGDDDTFRVAMEVGVGSGWYQLLGKNHHLVSIERFGESGPGEEVAEFLGFTAGKIAKDILAKM